MPDGNLADRLAAVADETIGAGREAVRGVPEGTAKVPEPGEAGEPAMPVMPFPTFQNTPTLPQQLPGNGYESGRDSRAR